MLCVIGTFQASHAYFQSQKAFSSSKKLGEKLLLPTRQQKTAFTQENQRQLGKGGRKQGEMGSAALKKLCNRGE